MRRLLALSLLCLTVACDFGSEETESLRNFCAGEGHCAQGVCEDNLCIDDSGRSVEVVVEVLRPAADTEAITPQSWAYGPVSLSSSSVTDYVLPSTCDVLGRVRWGSAQVPATLRFERRTEQALTGVPVVPVIANTSRGSSGVPGAGAVDYQTKLVDGAAYDVVIAPSSDLLGAVGQDMPALRVLPPFYLENVLIAGTEGAFRLDVSFPPALVEDCAPPELLSKCTLRGIILSTNGIITTTEPGLQVRAIEVDTGRLVSSIGETDELGRFAIRVSDQTGEYRVRVTSVPGAEPFPSISFDPVALYDGPADGVRVVIPRLRPVEFAGRVIDEEGRPVPNASLRLYSDSIFDDISSQLGVELVGSFAGSTETTGDGRFVLDLLPGLYDVTVTPPESDENPWGVLLARSLVTEIGDQLSDALYEVPPQIAFSGSVLALGAEPASGVSVQMKSRQRGVTEVPLTEEDLARNREDTTDAEGRFFMNLDAGIFDASLKVPAQSGFAWLVEPGLDLTEAEGSWQRNYNLPAPIVASGVLTASDGSLLSGAQIRAYVFVGEGEDARAVQVADTVSDESGGYRLLIAPSSDAE